MYYYAPRHSFGLASLMKSHKWHTPVKAHKVSSLSYLCFLLLFLSADFALNPGPIDYPCGNCALEVLETDPAIECDEWGQWFHIQCRSIEHSTNDDLVASDHSFSWICSNCDCLNFSNPAQSSFASYESPNNYSVLTDESLPIPHPSPSSTRVAQPRGDTTRKTSKLRVLNVNCQSLVNKKAEFYSFLDTYKPDIVIGTESWFTSKHLYNEFFPPSLGYIPFRQDRGKDAMGEVFSS